MYNVPSKSHDHHKLELLGHNKNFNKKRIVQVDVIPEYNLLVLLTGIMFTLCKIIILMIIIFFLKEAMVNFMGFEYSSIYFFKY